MPKYTPQDRSYHRELIWENAVKLFEKRNSMTPKCILRSQRAFINGLELTGKNRYKTVDILDNYFKSKDKELGKQVFWNTVLKKVKMEKWNNENE